jgi:polyisoprenoid-binding protein YceI
MATTKWVLDPTHSEIQFKIKHLMITNVTGQFNQFDGAIEAEGEGFANAKVSFNAAVDSISTNNEQRDGHLKSPDFFDAATYPQITFTGSKFSQKDDEHYVLEGDLTMHGVTKPVSLDVEYGGIQQDPYGNTKAGFELNGKINRKDFGLTWGAVTEAGGVMLGDDVKILGAIQFAKQA